MPVTIRDVALAASVSVKTVSRALNDHPDVSASTRAAVTATAAALGYRPNLLARALRTGASGMIGLLLPDLLNPYYTEQARQLQTLATAAGYMLSIASYDYNARLALGQLRSFIAHRSEGLIWLVNGLDGEALDLVRAAQLPTVISGSLQGGVDHIRCVQAVPGVETYEMATADAVAHLIGLGHKRIAYITETSDLVQARLAAYKRALATHGIALDPCLIKRSALLCTDKLGGGYSAMAELLASGLCPTAVCTSSDLAAMGILRALREHGLRIPADVSVVGCDDIAQAAYTEPPLTTIRAPSAAMMQAMFGLLRHIMDPSQHVETFLDANYTLLERQSTGPAPATK
jgi:LacI family transcriptional regulator